MLAHNLYAKSLICQFSATSICEIHSNAAKRSVTKSKLGWFKRSISRGKFHCFASIHIALKSSSTHREGNGSPSPSLLSAEILICGYPQYAYPNQHWVGVSHRSAETDSAHEGEGVPLVLWQYPITSRQIIF